MWPFSQWTTAGRAAVFYITAGAFTVIWAGVWYVYLFNNPPAGSYYYWCTGFLVTGLAMVLIGAGLGMLSRSARTSDPPLAADPIAAMNIQPEAAIAPVPGSLNLSAPMIASNGQVVLVPTSSVLQNGPVARR